MEQCFQKPNRLSEAAGKGEKGICASGVLFECHVREIHLSCASYEEWSHEKDGLSGSLGGLIQ